ncbi:MAG: putative porin [Thermodesulfobacteriota bacterium]
MGKARFFQILLLLLALGLLFPIPPLAAAGGRDGDVAELKRKIEEMERQRRLEAEQFRRMIELMEERDRRRQEEIEGLKERIEELESAPAPEREGEKMEKAAAVKEKLTPFKDRLRVYGDFRLRSELDTNRRGKEDPRFRERIRGRLGAEYDIAENQLYVGARVRTGDSDDPRSPHQSLDSDFESFEIALDMAYLLYKPSFAPGLSLYGGKFAHPFRTKAVYNELVWDSDVQPEGFSASYAHTYNGLLDDVYLTAGQYILEREGSDISWLTVAQLAVSKSFGGNWKIVLASGLYLYSNLTPGDSPTLARPPKNAGNATVDTDGDGQPDAFLSDFGILDSFLNIEYKGLPIPVVLTGQYFHNFGADIDEDDGFSVGVQVGKASEPGQWKLYYQFQIVEQDSIFTPFSQDDFLLATNFLGHVGGITYRISKRVSLNLWTLIAKRDRTFATLTDENQIRTRLDVNVKF